MNDMQNLLVAVISAGIWSLVVALFFGPGYVEITYFGWIAGWYIPDFLRMVRGYWRKKGVS